MALLQSLFRLSLVSLLFSVSHADRRLSVESLEVVEMQLQQLAKEHQPEQIHELLGHDHTSFPDRGVVLDAVLETGSFPKPNDKPTSRLRRHKDLPTDELVQEYLGNDFPLRAKGRTKQDGLQEPSVMGLPVAEAKDEKKSKGEASTSSPVAPPETETQSQPPTRSPPTEATLSSPSDPTLSPPADELGVIASETETSTGSYAGSTTIADVPVVAFLYEPQTQAGFKGKDLELLETLTDSIMLDVFADAFSTFISTTTSAVPRSDSNLILFNVTLYFEGSDSIPSEQDIQGVADRSFLPDENAIRVYLDRLKSTEGSDLSKIDSVIFISTQTEIELLAPARQIAEPESSHDFTTSTEPSVDKADLLFLRVILVTSMILMTLFLVYLEARRQRSVVEDDNENIMKHHETDGTPTYRTSVLTEDGIAHSAWKKSRGGDLECFEEVSIGDESQASRSTTSATSRSPTVSPVRDFSRKPMLKTQLPKTELAKPTWATRLRVDEAKTTEVGEPSLGAITKPEKRFINASPRLIETTSSDKRQSEERRYGDYRQLYRHGAEHASLASETESVLSIPTLETPKEFMVDNQEMLDPECDIDSHLASHEDDNLTLDSAFSVVDESVEGDEFAVEEEEVTVESDVEVDDEEQAELPKAEPEWIQKFKEMDLDQNNP